MSFKSLAGVTNVAHTHLIVKKENHHLKNTLPDITASKNDGEEDPYAQRAKYPEWEPQLDDNDNIYYYNANTHKSRWLLPCFCCDELAHRWCEQCHKSFCEDDFNIYHDDHAHEFEDEHTTTKKEQLVPEEIKPDEVHCIKCKKNVANKVCDTCWDPYCIECFTIVHHIGALKKHTPISYTRCKLGWMTIKKLGFPDRYVHGPQKIDTLDKPDDLMLGTELIYARNYRAHKRACEDNAAKIEKLREEYAAKSKEIEVLTLELDKLYLLNGPSDGRGGGVGGATGGGGADGAPQTFPQRLKATVSAINQALFTSKKDREYRAMALSCNDRKRGEHRTNWIKSIMDAPAEEEKKKKLGHKL